MSATVTRAKIWEDTAPTCMARITGADAAVITQASLTGATYKIFDLDGATPTVAVDSGTLTVANVVFDALQTDARWTVDSTGYNFRHTPAATVFTDADHRYKIEYTFDPVSGEDFIVVFQVVTHSVLSS